MLELVNGYGWWFGGIVEEKEMDYMYDNISWFIFQSLRASRDDAAERY